MLGYRYLKSAPTVHTILFKNGVAIKKGTGISFFYFAPISTVVQVSTASTDIPFIFEEITSDFQEVTIQGQMTYRVAEPEKLAASMNFAIDSIGRYVSDDPEKLRERLIQIAQVNAHAFAQQKTLAQILNSASELSEFLQNAIANSGTVKMLGIEVQSLSVIAVKANPEMAKAMQADAREKLLQKADEAIFARRNVAIELERQIRENELNTERAVAEKQRQVREASMQADIAIEKQRAELVDQQSENNRKLSELQIANVRGMLDAMKESDWKTVMAAFGTTDSKTVMAMAFEQLAQNAEKIGRLDISPDLLRTLLDTPSGNTKR